MRSLARAFNALSAARAGGPPPARSFCRATAALYPPGRRLKACAARLTPRTTPDRQCGLGGAQRADFVRPQMPPLAGFELAQQQAANADADNPQHRQAGQLTHLTDLALAALIQDNAQPGVFTRQALQARLRRRRAVTVFQNNPTPPGVELVFVGTLTDQYPVFFLVPVARMRQFVRQFAIIGEQDQSLALQVQPAYDKHVPGDRNQIAYRLARLFGAYLGENALRLVERNVNWCLFPGDRLVVNSNRIALRVSFRPQHGHHSINPDSTGGD